MTGVKCLIVRIATLGEFELSQGSKMISFWEIK